MVKQEDQVIDGMWKVGRGRALATIDGGGRGGWGPQPLRGELRKLGHCLSYWSPLPRPSLHSCHTSLLVGLQDLQLIPASGPLFLPFPPMGMLFPEKLHGWQLAMFCSPSLLGGVTLSPLTLYTGCWYSLYLSSAFSTRM